MPKITLQYSVEEIIIFSASLLATATLIPFSIYRYMNGQYGIAMFEATSLLLILITGFYAWKTRNTKPATFTFTCLMLLTHIGLSYMIGTSILFWIYPIIMTAYFLNSVKTTAILTIPAILAYIPLLLMEKSTVEITTILVTIALTQFFGHIVSTQIRKQHNSLKSLANRDGLTGALNRRSLDTRLDFLQELYFHHKRKDRDTSSVILFDIDDFKSINDNYGHHEGDETLIKLTQTVKNYIRSTDQFYRYGGEEFVIVANGANLIEAAKLAEKIRLLLESSHLSDKTLVTASFGVAEIQKSEKPTEWLGRADKALYRAKRAGKNRIFLANAENTDYDETPPLNKIKVLQ